MIIFTVLRAMLTSFIKGVLALVTAVVSWCRENPKAAMAVLGMVLVAIAVHFFEAYKHDKEITALHNEYKALESARERDIQDAVKAAVADSVNKADELKKQLASANAKADDTWSKYVALTAERKQREDELKKTVESLRASGQTASQAYLAAMAELDSLQQRYISPAGVAAINQFVRDYH